jgi:hypothetical protein
MEANKLFLQNYRNENECVELKHFVKTITKEFKKTGEKKIIKYYPWAVIERLFRSQGGKVEVVEWAMKVELTGKDYAPNELGELVLQETKSNALFIHLKATWQGQEEQEYYPIFDNQNAKIIKIPDALDLNTAKQRGMVRLIARLSGIGLEIFEQQEGQFEEEKENIATAISVRKKQDKTPDLSPSTNSMFAKILSGNTEVKEEEVEEVEEPIVETPTTFGNDTQEYADLLLEVRKMIREKTQQPLAKKFLADLGKELLSQLTYPELIELKGSL